MKTENKCQEDRLNAARGDVYCAKIDTLKSRRCRAAVNKEDDDEFSLVSIRVAWSPQ